MTARHGTPRRIEPRPGTRRRELWDRLVSAAGGWVEFHTTDYAASKNSLASILAAFRDDYGLDVECGGSGHSGQCRWRTRT